MEDILWNPHIPLPDHVHPADLDPDYVEGLKAVDQAVL